jgi:hypothetical protein
MGHEVLALIGRREPRSAWVNNLLIRYR